MAYLLDTNHCFLLLARSTFGDRSCARRRATHDIRDRRRGASIWCGCVGAQSRKLGSGRGFSWPHRSALDLPATAQHYADMKARLLAEYGLCERTRRRGFDLAKIGFTDNDLWIAASAIEHNALLVSDDGDFRRMSDVSSLKVETWLR